MKNWSRISLVVLFTFILLFGSLRPVQAAEYDDDGKISAEEVIDDDVFLTGEKVVMDGTVNGLLFATGETVTIHGTVNGDLVLMGNNVFLAPGAKVTGNVFLGARTGKIEGSISGSLFGGAASVVLENTAVVEGNLYYGGYNFQSMPESAVTRDTFLGVYQAILDGNIGRDAYFGGAALELNGSVGRNMQVDVASQESAKFTPVFTGQEDLPKAIASGIRVSETAKIGGKLVYTSPSAQSEAIQSEPAGGLVYQTPVPEQNKQMETKPPALTVRYPVLGWLADFTRTLVTLLAFGALALWLLPGAFKRTVSQANKQPAQSAGYGVLAIFSGYFSALVALVLILLIGLLLGLFSLGGMTTPVFGIGLSALSLIVAAFSFLVTTGSKLVIAYLIGQLLIDRAFPQASNRQIWALITGVVIYTLIRSIPVVGLLVAIAATLVGIGAMWLAYQSWRKPVPPAAEA